MLGSLDSSTFLLLLALMVGMWIAQFGMTYRQMRGFYGRLKQLRQRGLTAVGQSGSRVRGRAYAVLVVDSTDRVVAAEALRGWTVFATLRPVPALVGLTLADVLANEATLAVSEQLRPAFGNAARSIAAAQQPVAVPATPDATLAEA